MPGTRKLGRTTDHRIAMIRGMVTLLLKNGSVETTVTRAKEVRSVAEKMITLAKKANKCMALGTAEGKARALAYRRQAIAFITEAEVVEKLFGEIALKYESRNGGYTQIFKTGYRRGDAAEMAIIKLVDDDKAEAADKK